MDSFSDFEHRRPDGGTDEVLDSPPVDAVADAALTPEALAENAPRLETVVQFLNRPMLARIYVYVCYRGPVTPPAIREALDLSKSTTYEYVDTLTEFELVERDDSTRPQRLTADPLVILEQYAPIIITPTVLHAIGLQEVDEDIAYFVERHGVGKLVAALRGAGLHFAGKTTQRMVATDIDVRDTEAMIVYALRPALALGREHDPYFAYLFPDVHDQLDLPEPIPDDGGHKSGDQQAWSAEDRQQLTAFVDEQASAAIDNIGEDRETAIKAYRDCALVYSRTPVCEERKFSVTREMSDDRDFIGKISIWKIGMRRSLRKSNASMMVRSI